MMRGSLILAASLALSGCAGFETGFLGQLANVAADQIIEREQPELPPLPPPTRSGIPGTRGAAIAVGRVGIPESAVVTAAASQGDDYVVYQDATRRSIVMHGGQLSGTQGFLYDLAAVKSQPDDPIVTVRPLAEWPSSLLRNYQFTLQSAADYQISVICVLEADASETMAVNDRSLQLTLVRETCSNDVRTFTNQYWMEAETGVIWKSIQWAGPRSPAITLEVIEPFRET